MSKFNALVTIAIILGLASIALPFFGIHSVWSLGAGVASIFSGIWAGAIYEEEQSAIHG